MVANMKTSKSNDSPADGRGAGPGDPGDPGLRGPGDPRVTGQARGGHAPDADSKVPKVPEPGGRGRLAKPEMHPSPPEADGGLRGPPDDVEGGGKDGGHAPSNADNSVKDNLSQTIVKLDRSVKGRSPLTLKKPKADIDILRQPQYSPTWLTAKVGHISCDFFVCDTSDTENAVSTYNSYLWQGPGGIKTASLPDDIKFVKSSSRRSLPLSSPNLVHIKTFCTSSQTVLPDSQRTASR